MNRFFVVLIIAIVALVGCRSSSKNNHSTTLSEADRQAIVDLRVALVGAILEGDADAYTALCTDDVHLLHPSTPLITGRTALRDQEARVFEVVRVTKLVLSPVEVYSKGDLAYEVGTQEVAIEPSDERFLGTRKYVHVLKREADGQWRFAVLMSNNSQ